MVALARGYTVSALLALLIGLGGPALAVPAGSPTATEALSLCNRANDLEGEAKDAALARGRSLAESAIAADEHDAKAHFALVCTLGKQMERSGLGFSQLFGLRRLRSEIETTLRLAPADGDALATKGVLLFNLPRLLGGDPEEAERLLRAALTVDPQQDDARCYLARALSARGAEDEARALHASR